MKLTFTYSGDFTIATDTGTGQTFRVLYATGTKTACYCLEPWNHGKAVFYKRRFVDTNSPLFLAVDAAEKARPRQSVKLPKNIEADFA